MNVRTVTLGVPLADGSGLAEIEPAARRFLDAIRAQLAREEVAVRTCRITTDPVRGAPGRPLNPAQVIGRVRALSQVCERLDVRWFNVPFDLVGAPDDGELEALCSLAYDVLRRFPRSFVNLICAAGGRLSHDAMVRASRVVKSVAALDSSGFHNFRVGVSCGVPANGPFFPFTFSSDAAGVSLGLEMPQEMMKVVGAADGSSLVVVREALLDALVPQVQRLDRVVGRVAGEEGFAYHGIDVSIAPYPESNSSVAQLMEMLGLEQYGGHGTLFLTAYLTDFLRELIRRSGIRSVGFNGVMLSLLEDERMGQRNNSNTYSIDSLILYSTVCGCGVDMVPVPGDTFEEELSSLFLDVAAASLALGKPLGVRVLPIPMKQENEFTGFNMEFLFNTRIKKMRNLGFLGRALRGEPFGFLGPRRSSDAEPEAKG